MSAAVAAARETTFDLRPRGPFSLDQAARFWGGFVPAQHRGPEDDGHLHMAFAVEGSWEMAGVCVRQHDGRVEGRVYGDAPAEAVERQVERILSLDVDGRDFEDVGRRDPVVGNLQERFPGLRPVCFYSPFEAAAWAIISQRQQMRQAAAVKARLAEALGPLVDVHGQSMRAFPSPRALVDLEAYPGLVGDKAARLRAAARAALDGRLDAVALRARPAEEALADLRALPGIGPFSAELILLRGAGHPDYLTFQEPRFRRAVGAAYGFDGLPADAELERISQGWRPYRTWVTFLLRQAGGR
jgi:DNA-3-methyladenine glycosylase II